MAPKTWLIPTLWSERAVAYILGGGPSLSGFDVERLRGHGHTIAVNNAYRIAPWADVLYFADLAWLTLPGRDHVAGVRAFAGLKVTREPSVLQHVPDCKLVSRDANARLGTRPAGGLAGLDSGANAVNLAWLLGARRRIVTLGFDMKRNGHWHIGQGSHGQAKQETFDKYVAGMTRMAGALKDEGCLLLNASPGSALDGVVAGVPFTDLPLP